MKHLFWAIVVIACTTFLSVSLMHRSDLRDALLEYEIDVIKCRLDMQESGSDIETARLACVEAYKE